ncbi:disulfide bond formation protein DsbB [Thalassotalea mangrovi]|uniref:Disulfide bond formation protein B n=1 Tax=Thalassotalea mangrovi TaxID=2572245 RepID=A0A4U1B768_9GAMM|nr:disulfide bond formation protein DsbB [Thalassotalea mangrovi]TKB45716.1 disulfide bond formation protein DsbB [Thalassotalea mangrovi]
MFNTLNRWVMSSKSWWLLALSAITLEMAALYFQYGMGLEPCIMCIYQRVAIFGIAFAGIIGALGNRLVLLRLAGFAIWGVSAIWGLIIALEHVEMQTNANSLFFSCDIVPNFPQWLPLHQWVPAIFEATGDCGEISWSLLGYSMPQWMVVVYGVYSALFVVFLCSHVLNKLGRNDT